MKKLILLALLISCGFAEGVSHSYQSTTIQISNFNYRLSSPNTEDDIYNTQTYELRHTDILTFSNFRLTSQLEASKRVDNYLHSEFFSDEYIYFKALYLEYYMCQTLSLYGGIIPYTADFLNIYAHAKEEIGEGLSLINGNIKTTLGITYKNKNLKMRLGYIPTLKSLGKGPYDDVILFKGVKITAYTYGGNYVYNKHKVELDGYFASFNSSSFKASLKANAVSYIYDDFDNSGYSLSLQYALSEASKDYTRRGQAYNIALKVDSDLLPIYSFKYGIEYIDTSKYFKTANTSVVNNRANTFYKGSSLTVFTDFHLSKNYGIAMGYNYSHYDNISTSNFTEVHPIDLKVNALYTSLFYHF